MTADTASARRREGPSSQRTNTILVVDDSEFFRTELIEFLNSQSAWRVVGEARNGAEAISLTRSLEPTLVLMDIHMPEMDGIEASHLIKKADNKVKIVFLTIQDDEIHHWLAEHFQIDGFVSKPCVKQDLPKLLSKIEGELHGRWPGRII